LLFSETAAVDADPQVTTGVAFYVSFFFHGDAGSSVTEEEIGGVRKSTSLGGRAGSEEKSMWQMCMDEPRSHLT